MHRCLQKCFILDEMGLGKTVTVLSLIVAHQDTDSPTVPTPTGRSYKSVAHQT